MLDIQNYLLFALMATQHFSVLMSSCYVTSIKQNDILFLSFHEPPMDFSRTFGPSQLTLPL